MGYLIAGVLLLVFTVSWAGWAYYKRDSSITIRAGGGFIVAVIALMPVGLIIGLLFDKGSTGDVNQQQVVVESQEPTAQPREAQHYYSMRDGNEYGYEMALSQDAINQGQVAPTMAMFRYHGSRDGKFQASTTESGDVTTTLECSNPCEFMKIIVSSKSLGHIKTERMRAAEGAVGWYVMQDAINGKMEQYIGQRNGKKYTVWVEESGVIKTPVN